MAITLKKKNFAKSTLNSGISDVAVSLTAASGGGTRFPASGVFRAVLWGASYTSPSDDPNVEVVEAELNAGDVFDITRAKEGTSAQAWSAEDNFTHVLTAGTIEEIEAELDRPAFSAYRNTDQTGLTPGVYTKIVFNAEEFDTHADFDTALGRFTPSVAGKYLLAATVTTAPGESGKRVWAAIYKNGVLYQRGATEHMTSTAGGGGSINTVLDANGSTDYFEIYVRPDTVGNLTAKGGSDLTHFSGCRIA